MIKELLSDMDGFRKGNATAFQEVKDIHGQALIYFARRLIHNKQEAEDIVSEAVYELWSRHQQFDAPEKIRAFLYVTTRRKCYNYLKKMNRRKKGDEELRYLCGDEVDDGDLQAWVDTELIEKLMAALEHLPEKRRQVVQLMLDRHSHESIARQLAITPKNVSSHLYNAIQQLRKLLVSIMFYLVSQIF